MKAFLASAADFLNKAGKGTVNFILKPFGKSITDSGWEALVQFIKFGLVGAMNTLVDYFTYLITLFAFTRLHLFGEKAYLAATFCGFAVSFVNMFYWNNKYVFKKKEGESRSAAASFVKLFFSYALTGVVIKPVCMYLLVDIAGFWETLAPIPVMLVTIPLNFILSKLWAFKAGKREKNDEP